MQLPPSASNTRPEITPSAVSIGAVCVITLCTSRNTLKLPSNWMTEPIPASGEQAMQSVMQRPSASGPPFSSDTYRLSAVRVPCIRSSGRSPMNFGQVNASPGFALRSVRTENCAGSSFAPVSGRPASRMIFVMCGPKSSVSVMVLYVSAMVSSPPKISL